MSQADFNPIQQPSALPEPILKEGNQNKAFYPEKEQQIEIQASEQLEKLNSDYKKIEEQIFSHKEKIKGIKSDVEHAKASVSLDKYLGIWKQMRTALGFTRAQRELKQLNRRLEEEKQILEVKEQVFFDKQRTVIGLLKQPKKTEAFENYMNEKIKISTLSFAKELAYAVQLYQKNLKNWTPSEQLYGLYNLKREAKRLKGEISRENDPEKIEQLTNHLNPIEGVIKELEPLIARGKEETEHVATGLAFADKTLDLVTEEQEPIREEKETVLEGGKKFDRAQKTAQINFADLAKKDSVSMEEVIAGLRFEMYSYRPYMDRFEMVENFVQEITKEFEKNPQQDIRQFVSGLPNKFEEYIQSKMKVREELLKDDVGEIYKNYGQGYFDENGKLEKLLEDAKNDQTWDEDETRFWEHQLIPSEKWATFSSNFRLAFGSSEYNRAPKNVLLKYFEGIQKEMETPESPQ